MASEYKKVLMVVFITDYLELKKALQRVCKETAGQASAKRLDSGFQKALHRGYFFERLLRQTG